MTTAAAAKVREFFLLEQASARSGRLSAGRLASVSAYCGAASRRLRAASALGDPLEVHAALSLCRGAFLLYAIAWALADDPENGAEASPAEEILDRFERVSKDMGRELPASYPAARRVALGTDPVAIEQLSIQDARSALEDLFAATRWLATLVEPRSVAQIRTARRFRLLAVVAATVATVALVAARVTRPTDLALHATVNASSWDFNTQPAGAVDGELSGTFGFHSRLEDGPWLAIDLGRPFKLETIKVYGRGDCCFDQSVPLDAEVSDDGVSYRPLGTREAPFSENDPWVLHPGGSVARFVRLRTQHHAVLVLGEVEVYGSRVK